MNSEGLSDKLFSRQQERIGNSVATTMYTNFMNNPQANTPIHGEFAKHIMLNIIKEDFNENISPKKSAI